MLRFRPRCTGLPERSCPDRARSRHQVNDAAHRELRYGRRMIPRYTPKAFAELWSDRNRYQTWLEVELAACEAMEVEGLVPAGTARAVRDKNITLNAARIEEIEQTTRHDIIAFLTHVEELAGEPARWLHRGMTSSDVVDTSFSLLLVRAADLLLERTDGLIAALAARAKEHARTPLIGRSHGIHAEPVTFGVALAGHLAEIKRGKLRLQRAKLEVACGKIAGAVGTYAHLSPSIEERALSGLGLSAETVSTQVVARDRHAAFFLALSLLATGIERLAINVRHWQRTEVGEAEEFFKIYKLEVVVIPTNQPMVRADSHDLVYRTERAKFDAVADEAFEAGGGEGEAVGSGTEEGEAVEAFGVRGRGGFEVVGDVDGRNLGSDDDGTA